MSRLNASSDVAVEGLRRIKNVPGLIAKLAGDLKISRAAIYGWDMVPPDRVVQIEQHTGIPREILRPDLYPLPAAHEQQRLLLLERAERERLEVEVEKLTAELALANRRLEKASRTAAKPNTGGAGKKDGKKVTKETKEKV